MTATSQSDRCAAPRSFAPAPVANPPKVAGEVWLVGAGPGDPELLTLKALRCIQQADVILFDRLVSAEILALARPGCRRCYVGKAPARHALPQARLNRLMATLARSGRRVCRLKGGDPFLFGRGGEELLALARAGITVRVVPGVTAATACAAAAGIPLTHRHCAHSVVFVTATRGGDGSVDCDWERLARPGQTLVFYMGLAALPEIARQLRRHGLAGTTPAAAVQDGSRASERIVASTLRQLPAQVAAAKLRSPTLLLIGAAVALQAELAELRWNQQVSAPGQVQAVSR